jgi:hypothetical protein
VTVAAVSGNAGQFLSGLFCYRRSTELGFDGIEPALHVRLEFCKPVDNLAEHRKGFCAAGLICKLLPYVRLFITNGAHVSLNLAENA